jgi:hypothetical protein
MKHRLGEAHGSSGGVRSLNAEDRAAGYHKLQRTEVPAYAAVLEQKTLSASKCKAECNQGALVAAPSLLPQPAPATPVCDPATDGSLLLQSRDARVTNTRRARTSACSLPTGTMPRMSMGRRLRGGLTKPRW